MTFKKNTNSFADIAVEKKLADVDSFLLQIDKLISFQEIAPILKRNGIGVTDAAGRPSYNNISMFKVILIQKYYGISDYRMEESLKRDLLFMKFTGFGIEDETPDHTTICRFRNSMMTDNLYESLFEAVNKQLEEKGFIVKEGKTVLVDATLIESENTSILNKTREERKEHEKSVKEHNSSIAAKIEEELGKEKPDIKKIKKLQNEEEYVSRTLRNDGIDIKQGINTKDINESLRLKNECIDTYDHKNKKDLHIRTGKSSSSGNFVQGYKLHTGVSPEHGLITKVLVTFANTHESCMIDVILNSRNIKAVYADKAYDSESIREKLKAAGIENMICLKEKRGMPDDVKKAHRESEKPKHKVRARVEHPYAVIKTQMGQSITRFNGIVRNNLNYTLTALAANLKIMAHKLIRGTVSLNG